jgi:hypothetical protein
MLCVVLILASAVLRWLAVMNGRTAVASTA